MTEQKHEQFRSKQRHNKNTVQFQIEEKPPVRAVVLVPYQTHSKKTNSEQSHTSLEDRLEEAEGLAQAIDLDVQITKPILLESTRPATLLGTGKIEELKVLLHQLESELVIIDHQLTPGQQRNLERIWDVKILDRTGLILEIFGRRAATREGRLQVELAHLTYQKSRLVRSWTHLERQRGGKGFLGGPGETQLEADKRQIQTRILSISKELEKVKKTRELHRKQRRKVPYPVIALIGYTNAGKSTLFNRLTGAKVSAKDQLFATLDPTMRALDLPQGTKTIISDTVGFISNLPTQLVAAFRATLEEVLEADIILHVEDISNPNREQHCKDVLLILKDLGLNQNKTQKTTPIITVWNKVDCLSNEQTMEEMQQGLAPAPNNTTTEKQQNEQPRPILISALNGNGIDRLLETLEQTLTEQKMSLNLTLKPEQGAIVNWLYEHGEVTQGETLSNGNTNYKIIIPQRLSGRLQKMLS